MLRSRPFHYQKCDFRCLWPASASRYHLGPADGPVKSQSLAATRHGSTISTKGPSSTDPTRFAELNADHVKSGPDRSNLRYG